MFLLFCCFFCCFYAVFRLPRQRAVCMRLRHKKTPEEIPRAIYEGVFTVFRQRQNTHAFPPGEVTFASFDELQPFALPTFFIIFHYSTRFFTFCQTFSRYFRKNFRFFFFTAFFADFRRFFTLLSTFADFNRFIRFYALLSGRLSA